VEGPIGVLFGPDEEEKPIGGPEAKTGFVFHKEAIAEAYRRAKTYLDWLEPQRAAGKCRRLQE